MSYRLLLPCFEILTDSRLETAIEGLRTTGVSTEPRRWFVTTFALTPDATGEIPLLITVFDRSDIARKSCDNHFHQPRGVVAWLEVRAEGSVVDRPARLRARLVAMELARRLSLPVLETRNGVYCRTPQAFAAWCARESHPQVVKLGRREHMTPAPHRRPGLACPPAAVAQFKRPVAPLPRRGVIARAWHGLTGRRAYLIPLPLGCDAKIIGGLLAEVEHTFHRRYVRYQADEQRLVIYGKRTTETQNLVSYFRERSTPKHLGLVPAYSGL